MTRRGVVPQLNSELTLLASACTCRMDPSQWKSNTTMPMRIDATTTTKDDWSLRSSDSPSCRFFFSRCRTDSPDPGCTLGLADPACALGLARGEPSIAPRPTTGDCRLLAGEALPISIARSDPSSMPQWGFPAGLLAPPRHGDDPALTASKDCWPRNPCSESTTGKPPGQTKSRRVGTGRENRSCGSPRRGRPG